MNIRTHFSALAATAALALALAASPAWSSPGAHGPNGEHLDAPTAQAGGRPVPRLEARSEAFELVGQLQGGEFSILINRFASNEPVLGATVEVEFGKLKAQAPFHADIGDYAVADEAFLKALASPGKHALVLTVTLGKEADLLEGTLAVSEDSLAAGHDAHALSWRSAAIWSGGAAAAALLAFAAWRFLRRLRQRRPSDASHGSAA